MSRKRIIAGVLFICVFLSVCSANASNSASVSSSRQPAPPASTAPSTPRSTSTPTPTAPKSKPSTSVPLAPAVTPPPATPIDLDKELTPLQINQWFVANLLRVAPSDLIRENEVNDYKSDAIQEIVAEIEKTAKTTDEKVRASYDWMLNNMRVEAEPSDYPRIASEIAALGYGECDNYSILHAAILNGLGIPAAYVNAIANSSNIHSYTLRELAEDVHSNHAFVVAVVNGKAIVMDANVGDYGPEVSKSYNYNISLENLSKSRIIWGIQAPAQPLNPKNTSVNNLEASPAKLTIDGKSVPEFKAILSEGVNYLPVTALALALEENAANRQKTCAVLVGLYGGIFVFSNVPYEQTGDEFNYSWNLFGSRVNDWFFLNGIHYRDIRFITSARLSYIAIADLCMALDIRIEWDESTQTIAIDTTKPY